VVKYVVLIAALLIAALPGWPQHDAAVRVTLEPPIIPFHLFATYTITVETSADANVRLDTMLDKFPGLQVTGGPHRSTVPIGKNHMRISEAYRIEAVDPGEYLIDAAVVTINEARQTLPSPALRVRELTPEEQVEAEKFAGLIEPPPVRPEWYRDWRLWSFLILVLALLTALAFHLVRRRPHIPKATAPTPPWEIAYQRLRELDMRNLPRAGKYGIFFVDLSAILRYYIEDRFHVHAPEQTTPEFLAALADSRILDEDHQRFLDRFLHLSDRVKFAQYRPTLEEMDQSFVDVLQFIDDTVPKPEPQPQERAA
jgi:hypothetical protein